MEDYMHYALEPSSQICLHIYYTKNNAQYETLTTLCIKVSKKPSWLLTGYRIGGNFCSWKLQWSISQVRDFTDCCPHTLAVPPPTKFVEGGNAAKFAKVFTHKSFRLIPYLTIVKAKAKRDCSGSTAGIWKPLTCSFSCLSCDFLVADPSSSSDSTLFILQFIVHSSQSRMDEGETGKMNTTLSRTGQGRGTDTHEKNFTQDWKRKRNWYTIAPH